MPADTPSYMAPAWASCVQWAASEPEVLAAFRRETGSQWTPGGTAFDRQIDKATGAEAKFAEAFIAWVNLRIWGPIDGAESEAS